MTRPLPLSDASRTALDLARGLAAQAVLLGHAFDFFNIFSFLGQPDPPPQIQRLAVVLFFLLSGFLIARSLHSHLVSDTSTFGSYLSDRTARIYSGLIPALIFIAAADLLPFDLFEFDYFEGDASIVTLLANLLHLQHFPGLNFEVFGSGVPLWTLAIEWWLYVLAGALCLGLRPGRARLLAFALLFPALMSVSHNLVGGEGHGIALTWLLGALAYVASIKLEESRARDAASAKLSSGSSCLPWLLASSFAAGLGFVRLASLGPETPAKAFDRGFALAAAVAFILGIQATQRLSRPPDWLKQFATGLASYSYTLYLIHFSVLTIFYEWRGDVTDRLLLFASVVASNLLALAVSFFGERRRTAFRSGLGPRPQTE